MYSGPGSPAHGEVTSADAHSGVAVQLYQPGGGTLALASNEILAITDLTLIAAIGGTVSLVSFNATRTLTLFGGVVAASGGVSRSFQSPFFGVRGGTLRLTAPAGQIDCQVEGTIVH